MAKDDLASLGLDDDEIKLIQERRRQQREESDREVRIRTADGNEATLPFGQARNWLRKIGVLLDDDDNAGQAVEETEEETETEPDKPVRFGRRVG